MTARYQTPTLEELTREYDEEIREYEEQGYPKDSEGNTITKDRIATPATRLQYYHTAEFQAGLDLLNQLDADVQRIDYEQQRFIHPDDPACQDLADAEDEEIPIDGAYQIDEAAMKQFEDIVDQFSDVDVSDFTQAHPDNTDQEPGRQE